MHFSYLGISFENAVSLGIGFLHSQLFPERAIFISSLLWNWHLSRCFCSSPVEWMRRSLKWKDCWNYFCLMYALCGCIGILNDHTSQHIIWWVCWSNKGEAVFCTRMRKWDWLFVHELQVQEGHLYHDKILKLVPRW